MIGGTIPGGCVLPTPIHPAALPHPPARSVLVDTQASASGSDVALPLPVQPSTELSSSKPSKRLLGSFRQKQQKVKDKLSSALSSLGPANGGSPDSAISSPQSAQSVGSGPSRNQLALRDAQDRRAAVSTVAFPSDGAAGRGEAFQFLWGELDALPFSTLPISAKSPLSDHPTKWADFVQLYRLGAIDISRPPPLPVYDPAAQGARIFGPAPSAGMHLRGRPGSTSSVGHSSQQRGSRSQNMREGALVDTSVSSTSFSYLFDRSAVPLSADSSVNPSNRLSSSDDDDASDKPVQARDDQPVKAAQRVWHVSLSGSDSDESDVSLFNARSSSAAQVVRLGMRAPNPCFERERQATLNLYRPEHLIEGMLASPSVQPSTLITKSIVDEVAEEEMATAPLSSLQVVVDRTLSQLLDATQCDAVSFVLIDTDICRVVSCAGRTIEGGRHCSRLRSVEAHLILNRNDGMVLLDMAQDVRFADRPIFLEASASEPRAPVRFYAGQPILSTSGMPLGAISVFDSQARSSWPSSHQRVLDSTSKQLNEALEEVLVREWKAREEKLRHSFSVFRRAVDRLSPDTSPLSSTSSVALPMPTSFSPTSMTFASHSRSSSKRPPSARSPQRQGSASVGHSAGSLSGSRASIFASSLADEVSQADASTAAAAENLGRHTKDVGAVQTEDFEASRNPLIDLALRTISAALDTELVYVVKVSCADSSYSARASPDVTPLTRRLRLVAACGLETSAAGEARLSWDAHTAAIHATRVYQNVDATSQLFHKTGTDAKGKLRDDNREHTLWSTLPWWYADRHRDEEVASLFRSGVLTPCNEHGIHQEQNDSAYILAALSYDSNRTYWAPEIDYLEQMSTFIATILDNPSNWQMKESHHPKPHTKTPDGRGSDRSGVSSHSRPGSTVNSFASCSGQGGVRSDSSSRSSTYSKALSFANTASSTSLAPNRSSRRSHSRPGTADSIGSASVVSQMPSLTSANSSPRAPFYALSTTTSFRSIDDGRHKDLAGRQQQPSYATEDSQHHDDVAEGLGGLGLELNEKAHVLPVPYRNNSSLYDDHHAQGYPQGPTSSLPFGREQWPSGIDSPLEWDVPPERSAGSWYPEQPAEQKGHKASATVLPRRSSVGRLPSLRSSSLSPQLQTQRAADTHKRQLSPSVSMRKSSLHYPRTSDGSENERDEMAQAGPDGGAENAQPRAARALRIPRLGSALTIRQTPSLKEMRVKVMGPAAAAQTGKQESSGR